MAFRNLSRYQARPAANFPRANMRPKHKPRSLFPFYAWAITIAACVAGAFWIAS